MMPLELLVQCRRLNDLQHHVKVYLRYFVSQFTQRLNIPILATVEAPIVDDSLCFVPQLSGGNVHPGWSKYPVSRSLQREAEGYIGICRV